jgi:hypothetical protein
MKKIDVGQTIQMLANVGVVAGIVFLAFELQQNNELLAAEARVNQLEARRGTALQLTNNPQLAGILYRLQNGEAVTPEEHYQFTWLARDAFARWEWQFEEYKRGFIAKDSLPVDAWAGWFRTFPEMKDEWDAAAAGAPDFRRFMDENVIRLNDQ